MTRSVKSGSLENVNRLIFQSMLCVWLGRTLAGCRGKQQPCDSNKPWCRRLKSGKIGELHQCLADDFLLRKDRWLIKHKLEISCGGSLASGMQRSLASFQSRGNYRILIMALMILQNGRWDLPVPQRADDKDTSSVVTRGIFLWRIVNTASTC